MRNAFGDVDEEKTSPARTYLRALDGVIAEGMFFTERRPGKPPPPERQAEMLGLADYAKKNGVQVFTLDYGNDSKFVDKAHAEAQKRDFVSLVSSRPLLETSSLPTYPRRPFGENPKSILSLGARFQAYGFIGGFLVLTLWVWLLGVILYFGQCWSVVIASMSLVNKKK